MALRDRITPVSCTRTSICRCLAKKISEMSRLNSRYTALSPAVTWQAISIRYRASFRTTR